MVFINKNPTGLLDRTATERRKAMTNNFKPKQTIFRTKSDCATFRPLVGEPKKSGWRFVIPVFCLVVMAIILVAPLLASK